MALIQEKELVFGRGLTLGAAVNSFLQGSGGGTVRVGGRSRQTESSNQRTRESLRRVMSSRLCLSGRAL